MLIVMLIHRFPNARDLCFLLTLMHAMSGRFKRNPGKKEKRSENQSQIRECWHQKVNEASENMLVVY